jgi:hypothetical protein
MKLLITQAPVSYLGPNIPSVYITPLVSETKFTPIRNKRWIYGFVYDRLNIGIAGSNPARGMDVCLRVSVLCCPVFR